MSLAHAVAERNTSTAAEEIKILSNDISLKLERSYLYSSSFFEIGEMEVIIVEKCKQEVKKVKEDIIELRSSL